MYAHCLEVYIMHIISMNNKKRVAINGFGRIGRAVYKIMSETPGLEVVAINDLGDKNNLKYLLQYDSVFGKFDVSGFDNITFLQEKDPQNLPWKDLNIDVVVESTGFFRDKEKAKLHIKAGAKHVVISAPSTDAQTALVGMNVDSIDDNVSSNASCTTNAINPVVAILNESIGIEKAILNTIHSYTATQKIVDGPSLKDFRRGRAAAVNIIPTSTGAAKATARVHTYLEGKFDGISVRVPTPAGSLIDLTFVSSRDTTKDEVNKILEEEALSDRWKGILAATNEPIVLSDIVGRREASIVDLSMTHVVDGNLIKVLSWYDNETGYANMLVRHVLAVANKD